VILLLKTGASNPVQAQEVMHLGVINVHGWISEIDKMALYDLADININFSVGGAFELNCLEALVRGTPCLAHRCCGWADYLPHFLAVKKGEKLQPLPGNRIHTGYGYAPNVNDAVDMAEEILDCIDEYKLKTKQHAKETLIWKFNWYEAVAVLLSSLS